MRARLAVVGAAAAVLAAGCGAPNQFDVATNKPLAADNHVELPGAGVAGPGGDFTAQAPPSSTCLNGWAVPAPTNPLRDELLAAVARAAGVRTTVSAAEVRVFIGPAALGADASSRPDVFGYVAVTGPDAARGRWLLRGATVTGLRPVAVAAAGTTGWRSPDWTAFRGGGAPAARPGLPGRWAGSAYDAVTGHLVVSMLVGCLAGTGAGA